MLAATETNTTVELEGFHLTHDTSAIHSAH